jgi:DNA-binding transcriptional regulator YdaS (Cro superfamily)
MDQQTLQALDEAIDRAGGVTALAKALGIFSQAVSQWRHNGIPPYRVIDVEQLSGVPRWRLDPKLYPPAEYQREHVT